MEDEKFKLYDNIVSYIITRSFRKNELYYDKVNFKSKSDLLVLHALNLFASLGYVKVKIKCNPFKFFYYKIKEKFGRGIKWTLKRENDIDSINSIEDCIQATLTMFNVSPQVLEDIYDEYYNRSKKK